jgi:hypothetical protein
MSLEKQMEMEKLINDFIIEKRHSFVYKTKFNNSNFPDDFFDQTTESFYNRLVWGIEVHNMGFPVNLFQLFEQNKDLVGQFDEIEETLPEKGMKDPSYPMDPNSNLNDILKFSLEEDFNRICQVRNLEVSHYLSKIHNLFSEEFWNKLRNWVALRLNTHFLHKFYSHKTKFTEESLDKIIDAAALRMVASADPPKEWSKEQILSHFNPVILVSENVNLILLYLILGSVYIGGWYCYNENMIFWLNHNIFIPKIRKRSEREIFSEIMPDILKPIPNELVSSNLQTKVLNFLKEFTHFQEEHIHIVFRVFMNFAYYGLINGRIPGIKQGKYSINLLENELDELLAFKSAYYSNH